MTFQQLNISSFNTAKVTDMEGMFRYFGNLTTLNLSNFNTANVTDMSHMFQAAKTLTSLSLTSFNTAKVTDMMTMFSSCENLVTLDLSSFDTSNVTVMDSMFSQCTKLKTIYASSKFVTTKITSSGSNNLFWRCKSIVGGNGTTHVCGGNDYCPASTGPDSKYARIDTAETPGYFTRKTATP